MTMPEAQKQAAIDAALAQIDAAFGKGPDTPKRRKVRAKRQLEKLLPVLDGARKAVEHEKAEKAAGDDCPDIPLDPFTAYAVGWFLREEADRDESIAIEGVSEALEDMAGHIETGSVFGSAEDLLAEVVDEIHRCAYVIEHGEEPPAEMPKGYRREGGWDGLPF